MMMALVDRIQKMRERIRRGKQSVELSEAYANQLICTFAIIATTINGVIYAIAGLWYTGHPTTYMWIPGNNHAFVYPPVEVYLLNAMSFGLIFVLLLYWIAPSKDHFSWMQTDGGES